MTFFLLEESSESSNIKDGIQQEIGGFHGKESRQKEICSI